MSYSGGLDLYEVKFAERNEMRDSLMRYVEPDSFEWYFLNREAALSAMDSVSVRVLTEKMLLRRRLLVLCGGDLSERF